MSQTCDVLLLSVSAGAGHIRAAEAIRSAALREQPDVRIEHLDVMEVVPSLFKRLYADSYLKLINRHPAFWGYLYHASDRTRPDSTMTRLREALERLNTRKLLDRIRTLAPKVIICTHFLPAQLLGRLRRLGQFDIPVHVVVTDFDVHLLWVHQGLSSYCVASDEVAWRLRERGIGDTPVTVTGIPIDPAFASPPDRATCLRELGLDPARKTILLMSGGHGVGDLAGIAARCLAIPGDHQCLAMAGRNADLLSALEGLARQHPGRLVAQGFTRSPERLMVCADLAIGKPGGLSTSECLALGLPMLIVSPIPGQEERNADHLLEHGAALKAHDAAGLEHRLRRILGEPALLPRLAANAKAIGRPFAARDVFLASR
jgi:processive 1,2-diacylglycerol beta-glucosyltransferase